MKPLIHISTLIQSVLIAALPAATQAQNACLSMSSAYAETGWTAYRVNDMDEARAQFDAALARCDSDQYARTGLGYVELREGNTVLADSLFSVVVTADPNDVDALTGLGLARWRVGDLNAVRDNFTTVLRLSPDHPTAVDYLRRIEGYVLGPPPDRPALELPEELAYPARTSGDRFEVRTAAGWKPFYIKGVNLGAALPGKHPSEFPDFDTYARWIQAMVDMNANTVRVYTIHPPAFYRALRDWNARNPDQVLWLIHGVWTELPSHHDYRGKEFEGEFFSEMRDVVDLIHGRADVEPRPGHAFGYYTADVSRWTLAYIIGREWEPFSAVAFDSIRGGAVGFEGDYVRVRGGNAMDAWMARAVEEMVAYETEEYRAQRPIAYTNWPTLDPLEHPTEPTVEEEMAIRRARGETPDVRIREYDNDALALDAALVSPTERLPAGYFASFHAYPYYPDFMIMEEGYQDSESSMGRSNYFGYLEALKAHHQGMPVVISEYGVPASLGAGHLQPQGWHHGALTEDEMARINRRLTIEMAEAGLAGGVLFAWMDEWFKKNWVTLEFELPAERGRLWYNRLNAEEHYGLWAMDAEPPFPGLTLEERRSGWDSVEPLYEEEGLEVRAASDAAYLWLLVETAELQPTDTIMVGFDVIDPTAGDFTWPGRVGSRLPIGVEFVMQAIGDEVRVLADPPSNPFRHVDVGQGAERLEGRRTKIISPPEGLFYARKEQRLNFPHYTIANDDGRYDSLRVIVNRRRFARDSTEYLGIGYERGHLPHGPPPDGFWERSADGTLLEVRIPWLLINVTDPSSRTVLQGPGRENARGAVRGPDGRLRLPAGTAWPDSVLGPLGTEQIDGIGIVATVLRRDGSSRMVPSSGAPVRAYRWEMWDTPRYQERARPTYGVMSEVFGKLDPYSALEVPSAHLPTSSPGPSGSSEEADAAWRAGEVERARALYEARLQSNPNDGIALHRLALMSAWIGDYDRSRDLFDRVLEAEPKNVDALVDRARVMAWQGDTDQALDALAGLLVEHPEHPGALEARALFEAWAGRYDEALDSYERLLSLSPNNGAARRQHAQVLSWASDFDGSRLAYEALLAEDPRDVDARLGLARTYAYSNDLEHALTEYDRILSEDPKNLTALQGKGRTLAWADRLIEGEEILRRALEVDDLDAGSHLGLGQILQWQGRSAAAKETLERAVALSPTNGDAREQLRRVNLSLAPMVNPSSLYESDSDGNRMVTTSLAGSWHPTPLLELRAEGYRKELDQGVLDRTSMGGLLSGVLTLEPGWTATLGLGGSVIDGAGDPTHVRYRAAVRSPSRHKVIGTLDLSSQVLDETAGLADRGVRFTGLSGSLRWRPTGLWRVDGSAGYASFGGTEDNARFSGSIGAWRRFGRFFSLGGGFRTFSYDKDLDDGYFDPDYYGLGELTGSWRYSPAPWSFIVEAAPGLQQVTRQGQVELSLRSSARIAYLIEQGRELSLSFGHSSGGLQSFSSGSSEYRYTALILSLNWVL